jgi:hypothetical protein
MDLRGCSDKIATLFMTDLVSLMTSVKFLAVVVACRAWARRHFVLNYLRTLCVEMKKKLISVNACGFKKNLAGSGDRK